MIGIKLPVNSNYYTQKSIALARIQKGTLQKNLTIAIQGKTTPLFTQELAELRDEQGNTIDLGEEGMIVTFPVVQKVRKHDQIVLYS